MQKFLKILKHLLMIILILFVGYFSYAGCRSYLYNHVYSTNQRLGYIYKHLDDGFPKTNAQILIGKEFKDNDVKIQYGTLLEPGDTIHFYTKHFDVKYYGGDALVDGIYYYKQDDSCLYNSKMDKKIKNDKLNHLYRKELREFTDKFGKHMGFQIYNPWNN